MPTMPDFPTDPPSDDTIAGVVARAAHRWPDALACVDGDRRWSFGDWGDDVRRAAGAYVAAGLAPGDRIALWAPNGAGWALASLGAAAAGLVVVPLNTRFKGAEAADLLQRARCRLLVGVEQFLGATPLAALAATGEALRDLTTVVVLGDDEPRTTVAGAITRSWADLLAAAGAADIAEADRRAAAVRPDDISHIQFTSGTTGKAKGAMLRHRAMVGTTRDWVANVGLQAGERYLIVSPYFHVSGHKTGVLACLTAGATMHPHAVFDPATVMQRVAAERITVLPGPPTIYQTLLAHPDRTAYDLSSLRLAVTGAASIPAVLVRRMLDELGFDTVITAYGITETTGVVTMCRPGDDVDTIAETSGRAVTGVEVRVVDESGTPLPPRATGEIVVRGYNVMAGYLDDPEATAAAVDADGWFHSGDLGDLDDHGNLRITDRITDVFTVGGFNTYPAEIEHQLLQHPDVVDAAVIGVPDERLGEVGMAFVVARAGHDLDTHALLAWCRERMANTKVPRYVQVCDALPVNASGKVTKFELRRRAAEAGDGPLR
jgi:acyl-CoA synthetase (AMP-forming)/AMP-acid ligase II